MNINCNIIIASFPRGSGGKCVINCLGLSNSATIMHHELAYGSIKQKSNYFTQQFALTLKKGKWDDLGLKTTKFVGHSLDNIDTFTPSELERYYWDLYFCDEFKTIVNGTKDVFVIAHSIPATKVLQNSYIDSRTIRLVNTADVVYKRSQYKNVVPKYVHIELSKISEQELDNFISWDCKWFENENIFLKNIEIFYDELGYQDFDTALPYIKKYYKHWTNVVSALK